MGAVERSGVRHRLVPVPLNTLSVGDSFCHFLNGGEGFFLGEGGGVAAEGISEMRDFVSLFLFSGGGRRGEVENFA